MLTVALMVFDEYSERFDRCVNIIADYMYIAFGPVLFIFCLFVMEQQQQLPLYLLRSIHIKSNSTAEKNWPHEETGDPN